MTETDIAYAAGFFDGEGCISISKNGAVDIRVTNTAKNVLVRLQNIFADQLLIELNVPIKRSTPTRSMAKMP